MRHNVSPQKKKKQHKKIMPLDDRESVKSKKKNLI